MAARMRSPTSTACAPAPCGTAAAGVSCSAAIASGSSRSTSPSAATASCSGRRRSASAPRSESAWTEELVATLRAAVERHLMSDVPLGVFLSGGLDSSTIVALMHELGVHPIRTFTIGFEERPFSETAVARQVATRFGTEHHELVVRPDAATLLPRLVHHFDEPFAD